MVPEGGTVMANQTSADLEEKPLFLKAINCFGWSEAEIYLTQLVVSELLNPIYKPIIICIGICI